MSEKYYVVSEKELERLSKKERNGCPYMSWQHEKACKDADAACRARPVPEWATHFYAETEERNRLGIPHERIQEILK